MNIDPSGNTSLGEMVTTLAAMPEVQCISVVVLTCLFGALVGAADAYLGGGDKNEIIQGVKFSKVYFVERQNVIWGHYSQIACEIELFSDAVKNKNYQFYRIDIRNKDN